MQVINPATGEREETVEEHSESDVQDALERSTAAYEEWRERPIREREELLSAAGDILRENKREYAETMTREMGKPISQALAEIKKCAWVCDHYAQHGSAYLEADSHPSPPGSDVKTVYDPLGPILAVMPWNFPFWQVFRFAAPHLTSGNVGLLNTPRTFPAVRRPSKTCSARPATPRTSSSHY